MKSSPSTAGIVSGASTLRIDWMRLRVDENIKDHGFPTPAGVQFLMAAGKRGRREVLTRYTNYAVVSQAAAYLRTKKNLLIMFVHSKG